MHLNGNLQGLINPALGCLNQRALKAMNGGMQSLDGMSPPFFAPAVDRTVPISSALASAVFDIDATLSASYPGTGQTIANIITAPADSEAQAAYDWVRGSTSGSEGSDPAFTGTANDAGAYFNCDGGDFIMLPATTTFLKGLHKSTAGPAFWLAMCFYLNSTSGGLGLFGTNRPTSDSSKGFALRYDFGSPANLISRWNSTAYNGDVDTGTDQGAGWNLIICSVEHISGNSINMRTWRNSFTPAFVNSGIPSGTDDGGTSAIAFSQSGFGTIPNGSRIVHLSMGNEYLDNTKAAALISLLETRHNRDYTP